MPNVRYIQIADELRQELEAGVYPEGQALPSTTYLQKRFGVANMTVRSAIAALRSEGYVDSQHGKGVYPVPAATRRLRGPSPEEELEGVRAETDPVEQARKATELLQLYEIRQAALVAVRKRAIARAERQGLSRTRIAKGMGITRARVTQLMGDIPATKRASSSRRT